MLICGGGTLWGSAYIAANKANRTVVGSEDVTVGLGGQIQNGGHGTQSSNNGLASDNLYQATVITSEGRRLVANDEQNQDLFWAIRGAGGGQFGVVTEFVLKTHPVPENVVNGLMKFYARDVSKAAENASWAALAELSSQLPDLMDTGITSTVDCMTGDMAVKYMGLAHAVPGPAVTVNFASFNSTTGKMNETLHKLITRINDVTNGNLNLTYTVPSSQDYWSFFKPNFLSSTFAGASRLFTVRLLRALRPPQERPDPVSPTDIRRQRREGRYPAPLRYPSWTWSSPHTRETTRQRPPSLAQGVYTRDGVGRPRQHHRRSEEGVDRCCGVV